MSDRATARHRAPQRPRTPLDSLTDTLSGQLSAVTDQLGSVSRNGAVLAVSTGLVATMGLPAGAVTKTAPETGASFARSSVASAGAVALPASVVNGAAVTAPGTASVAFERSSFTVTRTTPEHPRTTPRETTIPRVDKKASRSTARTVAPGTGARKTGTGTGTGGSASAKGSTVVSIARRYIGTPYKYGGSTPAGFDCSGFSQYVFAKVGIRLPRTSNAQYGAVRHISRSQAREGDIVFFLSGGRVTHLGILTRPGMMIDSPRSGKSISERAIWSSNVAYGRP